jgi:hypothetical protein
MPLLLGRKKKWKIVNSFKLGPFLHLLKKSKILSYESWLNSFEIPTPAKLQMIRTES